MHHAGMIERLAGSAPQAPAGATVLASCCRASRASALQDRICKLFGL